MTSIELLSPARDLECGMAAIDHGADAVYIGAQRFGARAAAGNSVDDIKALCLYAHQYGARVYVTVNTILYDEELEDTQKLIHQLYEVGVDALIVQDLALLKLDLPPIPLHASTQMDNRTPEKARALKDLGFRQIVLARELLLEEIGKIHEAVPDVPLEAFCHGALCVSYSGRCYASEYCFRRSANRGECAQFCRLPFTLRDSEGKVLAADKYLLSLRDMNRSASLEEMMDAGVRSFKIEGRLKDVSYVKNVTAYYRKAIDRILERRKEYKRSSFGTSDFCFTPDAAKSFSRGFTDYFLHDRNSHLASMDTPKSRGQEVGFVKEIRRDHIVVAGTASFSNGDGLCYTDENGKLQGFRVNKVEGNHLYPAEMPRVRKGDVLFRNYDQQWERMMSRPTAERRLALSFLLEEVPDGFSLTAKTEDGRENRKVFHCEHQLARTDQSNTISDLLCKLGDTIFTCRKVDVRFTQPWFIPRSLLAEWRRAIVEELTGIAVLTREEVVKSFPETVCLPLAPGFQNNVSNKLSLSVYENLGQNVTEKAFELTHIHKPDMTLMTCRYCIRYELGLCPRKQKPRIAYREPLYLESKDGRCFRLHFDCHRCEMQILGNITN